MNVKVRIRPSVRLSQTRPLADIGLLRVDDNECRQHWVARSLLQCKHNTFAAAAAKAGNQSTPTSCTQQFHTATSNYVVLCTSFPRLHPLAHNEPLAKLNIWRKIRNSVTSFNVD